jgi:hypothetical protein
MVITATEVVSCGGHPGFESVLVGRAKQQDARLLVLARSWILKLVLTLENIW